MAITLSPQNLTVTPFAGVLDTRAPNGVPLPTPNEAPTISGVPAVVTLTGTGTLTYELAPFCNDPNADALAYSLTATRTGVTINATTGRLTATSAAANTTGDITTQVSDGTLTASVTFRLTVTATTSGAKRWNPGHYVKTQGAETRTDQSNYWSGVFTTIDRAASFGLIKGCFVNVSWGSFNTTGSTFVWTDLDALFAKAAATNQRLIVAITYKNFEATVGLCAPADLIAANTHATASGFISAVWRASVMTRYLAAVQAFADRYGDNPLLEAVTWSESSPSWQTVTPPGDYSNSALGTQLQALCTAAAPMFPDNFVLANLNGLSGQTTQLINNAFAAGAGFSTPDAVDTKGIRLFRGETQAGEQTPSNGDLRGRMMHEEIASSPTLGGKDDNGPATNIINWSQTNDVTHLSWVTSDASPGCTWTDIQAAITADPLLHSAYPTG